jgi:hypothetical protein
MTSVRMNIYSLIGSRKMEKAPENDGFEEEDEDDEVDIDEEFEEIEEDFEENNELDSKENRRGTKVFMNLPPLHFCKCG